MLLNKINYDVYYHFLGTQKHYFGISNTCISALSKMIASFTLAPAATVTLGPMYTLGPSYKIIVMQREIKVRG